MRITNLLLLLSLMTSACAVSPSQDYVDMASAIGIKVSQELTKKYQMRLIGEGGAMIEGVNRIALAFRIRRDLNFEEARLLFIDCVETLIAAVNADEQLRPYLRNYPFLPENVDMAIYISDLEGHDKYHPFISVVSSFGSQIAYDTYDKEIKPIGYTANFVESYEDALVEARKDRTLPSLTLKEMEPIPDYLWAMANLVEEIKKTFKEQHDLILKSNMILFGEKKLQKLLLTFHSDEEGWSQDAARTLVLKCTQNALEVINHDAIIQPYLQTKPFTVKDLGLELRSSLYKKEKKGRDEIESVVIRKGKVNYWHYAAPSHIEIKATETYQEALSLDSPPLIPDR